MKKLLFLLANFFLFLPSIFATNIDLYSSNAILYDTIDDKIIYEKGSSENVSIASITKIMTAIVATEKIADYDETVTILAQDFNSLKENNASVAGFKVGQNVTYRDLLYGLLLPSGADAAQALVRLTYKTKDDFVEKMNVKAQELKMLDTHFTNVTGLDEKGQKSTLIDVVKMVEYAFDNSLLKEILSTSRYITSDKKLTLYSTVRSSINQVGNMPYVIGGKTGTTKNAGRALASYSNIWDNYFIVVTVGAPQGTTPYNVIDHKKIYEYLLNNYEEKNILTKDSLILTLPTVDAKISEINYYLDEDINKIVPLDFNTEAIEINYDGLREIPFNTKKDSKLGTLTISYDDEVLKTMDIYLEETLTIDYLKYLKHHPYIIVSLCLLIFILSLVIINNFKKKKK